MIQGNWASGCVAVVATLVGFGCGSGDAGTSTQSSTAELRSEATNTTACPGVWTSAPAYPAMVGTFARAGWSPPPGPGDLTSVTFFSELPLDPTNMTGSHREQAFGGTTRLGSYMAVPDNPAVGANILFGDSGYPRDGSQPYAMFFVLGLQHDFFGRVSAMCLSPTTRGSSPFEAVRVQ